MQKGASFALTLLAAMQIVLLGTSLGLLVLRLTEIRTNLSRVGQEEEAFLGVLAEAEGDLYRTSILLRDNIILEGPHQQQASRELNGLLTQMADEPFDIPKWVSPGIRARLVAVQADWRGYLTGARSVMAWREQDRKTIGPRYLIEMAPTREKIVATAREIAALVRDLHESRDQAMVNSIEEIQDMVTRILSGAALLGLALAAVAIWRFHHYEKERDIHEANLRRAEDGLRALSQRLVESQELERKKLSRELHDEVGQVMTALRVQLGQIEPEAAESRAHLKQASELAERSLRSVREMARGLRPAMLDDLGLAPALRWLGRDFSKNGVLDVDVTIEGELSNLDEHQRTCLYRVVQEALTNCVKHSGSGGAQVTLHESIQDVLLTVRDDGAGFSPGNAGGIGLLGMRERVEELAGRFEVLSPPGGGVLIRVTLPKAKLEKI